MGERRTVMEIEKVLFDAVVVFLVRDDEVLLARKTSTIGAGLWNGYGGGVESGETPEQATVRELIEESGIAAVEVHLKKVAYALLHNEKSDGTASMCNLHVYLLREWQGVPRETEEMLTPTWFPIAQLPLDEMMLADREWVPLMLEGKKAHVEAWYGPFQKTLLRPVLVQEVVVI